MAQPKFKVVIVGGSVSGLTLANMLEKLNIDYVVLESYRDIAPQVGASIGLQANGLRILDQLGCADALLDLVDTPLHTQYLRNSEGEGIKKFEGFSRILENRHGFPTIFIDRQMLLATLYENLKNKDKVIASAKVQTINTLQGGVEVVTADGQTFNGDLLVGADGVYSAVRQEMWRLAEGSQTESFPRKDWDDVYCAYKCIFGISNPMEKMSHGILHNVMNRDYSYLVIAGPGGRIYWFLFVKLARRTYGDAIPKYTKADEETLAKEHALDPIVPGVTFGDLYEAKKSSVLTPLHEYTLSKWHFGRSFLVGDSSHKFEPITGQGGNSAIETAASLVNHLTELLQSTGDNPSDQDIEAMFSSVQAGRFERASWLVKEAHKHQRQDAMETLPLQFLGTILPRFLDSEAALNLASAKYIGAPRINSLPVPPRYHSIPFEDELPARVLDSTWISGTFGILSQAGLFWVAGRMFGHGFQVPSTFAGAPLRQTYLGIPAVDGVLSMLVSVFGACVFAPDRVQHVQIGYFMPVIATSIMDWTIDSYRLSDNSMKTVWPSVAAAAYQLLGIGRIAPLYNIARTVLGNVYRPLAMSAVPAKDVPVATAIGLACGYVVPTILMFTPFRNFDLRQKFTALWQPSPVYVGILTAGIMQYTRRTTTTAKTDSVTIPKDKQKQKQRQQERRQRLISVYNVGFATTTLVHWYSMYHILKDPKLSLSKVFMPTTTPQTEQASSILNFLRWDMGLYTASAAVHGLQSILEFRSQGYVTTCQAVSTALSFSLGHAVVGPAAAQIGLSVWKEKLLLNMGI